MRVQMPIQFLTDLRFDKESMSVVVSANVNDSRKTIFISQETLQDHFRATNSPKDLIATFERNKAAIGRKILQIANSGVEGEIVVTTNLY